MGNLLDQYAAGYLDAINPKSNGPYSQNEEYLLGFTDGQADVERAEEDTRIRQCFERWLSLVIDPRPSFGEYYERFTTR